MIGLVAHGLVHRFFATPAIQGPGYSDGIVFFSLQSPGVCPAPRGEFYNKIPADSPCTPKDSVQSATSPAISGGKSKAPHNHGTTGTTRRLNHDT